MFLPRAKKSFGQHFLTDASVIERIVGALNPQADETIVEIGPGRGALTTGLVERRARVVAVELDRDSAAGLRVQFFNKVNLTLIEADALTVDFCSIIEPATSARVVANLPYNISTAILQRLIAWRRCLPESVLMLQREVVERMTAQPGGGGERGYLSVLTEAYCDAEPLFDVSPQAFQPVPKVWSTVVRLRMYQGLRVPVKNEELLWEVVGAGFAQRRKTIFNNLRGAPTGLRERLERAGGASAVLQKSDIEESRRAETLRLEEWARLADSL